jgi:CxC2 like cysteine cluster associated with KDZ transposases
MKLGCLTLTTSLQAEHMPPRKHFAKSQEFVYKPVGRGNRQKYRLVAVEVPRNGPVASSSGTHEADASPNLPPIVSAPSVADGTEPVPDPAYFDDMEDSKRKKSGKASLCGLTCCTDTITKQRQSDYMRIWLNEKRKQFITRIIGMSAGPHGAEATCPRCRSGRAVWRCKDCTDTKAICVLCCRNAHKLGVFHRIEKWNGRFYQPGALWQVGVKIYLGHGGKPCPRSAAALSGFREHVDGTSNSAGNVIRQVGEQIGLAPMVALQQIADALEISNGPMTGEAQKLLQLAAEKMGVGVLGLLHQLRTESAKDAAMVADRLQAESDKETAEAELGNDLGTGNGGEPLQLEDDIDGDNDNWEDEDCRPAKGEIPRFLPRPPAHDGAGNPFLTVVHTNGFHSLPVVWCACDDHTIGRDLQLLDQQLYPASYDRIKTVFTFSCLDDHRYDYLECKSSHYQYHNKLRRWTCPQYPDAAPNRYKELCRVARQWRNLKYRKWFWMLHDLNGKRGEMALFCAACPQDGINLPPGWQAEMEANP